MANLTEECNLFLNLKKDNAIPLAERMRPETLDGIIGQTHLLSQGKALRTMIEKDAVPSLILWGPPGVGKTSLARVIARLTGSHFITFSAVTSGIKEVKEVMHKADEAKSFGQKTMLFIDEIHRFNKSQQDAFLPFVEKGSITLIGATTENPSFEVNGALLSRCKVFILKPLNEDEIISLLKRTITNECAFPGKRIQIDDGLLKAIADFCDGDARRALSTLEMAVLNGEEKNGEIQITAQNIEQCTSRKTLLFDKSGEEHYNTISALHKSMRNSDPDAAVYWLARMLEAGEDPLYVARRILRFASEDVGLADPKAMEMAVAAYQSCHFLGMPECSVHLAQTVIYLSVAPKSNSAYSAYETAKRDALRTIAEPVPLSIRNAPTKLMEEAGYGVGYKYAHDYENKLTDLQCLPDSLKSKQYYDPVDHGLETKIKDRLKRIKAWKKAFAEKRDSCYEPLEKKGESN